MRGWTFINDEAPSDHYDENGDLTFKGEIREKIIAELVNKWNLLHQEIERRSFMSDYEQDDYQDYLASIVEDYTCDALDEYLKKHPETPKSEYNDLIRKFTDEFYEQEKKKEDRIYQEKEVVMELLSDMGVRMMRPYEHWNEDEKYMEYMENRYSYDDDYR